MENINIIRTWKDLAYRAGFTFEHRDSLPENPAAGVELKDAAFNKLTRGVSKKTQQPDVFCTRTPIITLNRLFPRLLALSALMCLSAASLQTNAAGPVIAWGDNSFGQVSPLPTGTFTAVSAGYAHSVAIDQNGTLVAWGANSWSQVNPLPTGTFSAVSAGIYHSVAMDQNGHLHAWGDNVWNLVGATPPGTFIAVSAGFDHSVAIDQNGHLHAWGDNAFSQVSPLPAGTFTAVSAGFAHSVAIDQNGTLVAWGDNSWSQVSPLPTGTFTAVSAGSVHNVAIDQNGHLHAWGNNSMSQVNPLPTGTFTAVSAGSVHNVAIDQNGHLHAWGNNSMSQVNPLPTGTFTAVSAGYGHNVAILDPCSGPDTISPTLSCSVPPVVLEAFSYLWPPQFLPMRDVGLLITATDSCSPPVTTHVCVYSNEPNNGPPDATFVSPILRLRAQRINNNNGRVYLIVVTATDNATIPNSTVSCTTVVVPKLNTPFWRWKAQTLAIAAMGNCAANGSPVTPFLIGCF